MMALSDAATTLNASVTGADVSFTGVSTDTRTLAPGDLFVALRGERFDAHDFVPEALARGACAAMVRSDFSLARGDAPLLRVADTRIGLGQLAAAWRKRWRGKLVAITGSNGKTTVKEMVASILRAGAGENAVLATQGNLNNDIGVPLTLLKLRANHRYAVIEMGMNHAGELEYLSRMAAPDVALVNNVQRAHLGMFADIGAVARAKAEIFVGLPRGAGVAVINADDQHAALLRTLTQDYECLEFGLEKPAPIRASYTLHVNGSEMAVTTPKGAFQIRLPLPGLHNVRNALAATAVAFAVRQELNSIAAGLERVASVKGRLVRKAATNGATLIDDTYNANPDSAAAAIAVLAAAPGERILVLGDMGEIGADAAELHAEVGARARAAGIEHLFTLGELSRSASAAFGGHGAHYTELTALTSALRAMLRPEVTVLVKGSRFMAMERVVEALAEETG